MQEDKEFKAILSYMARGQPGLLETVSLEKKRKTLTFGFHSECVQILFFVNIP